jgi:membrane protein YdbS with pleckstrin-like domain
MFTNEQIDVASLPKLEDLQMNPIDRKYLLILLLNIFFTYGIPIFGLLVANYLSVNKKFKDVSPYVLFTLILMMVLTMLIYGIGFKKRVYALRERDICYSHGYFINKLIALPFNRIQHIEIARSFLARKFGLATLKIYSAGESGSDLVIHGLPKDVAESQYAFLTQVINERV